MKIHLYPITETRFGNSDWASGSSKKKQKRADYPGAFVLEGLQDVQRHVYHTSILNILSLALIIMLKGLFHSEKKYQYEVAICCIVRDEEYLPEWIDYHILIGVTQFYIYDNESAVPVSDILKAYIEKLQKLSSFKTTVCYVGKILNHFF